jgi:hypothetical protein
MNAAIETDKAREKRLRRLAARLGYAVAKTRHRDPVSMDHRMFAITDRSTNTVIHGRSNRAFALEDAEAWLARVRAYSLKTASFRLQTESAKFHRLRDYVTGSSSVA